MTWLLIIFLSNARLDIIRLDSYEQCINRAALVIHSREVKMTMCEPDKGRDA